MPSLFFVHDLLYWEVMSYNPNTIKIGDTVTRMLAGKVAMPLKVTALGDKVVTCGAWTFDRATGAEIDEDLNWGPPPMMTGSFLQR